MPTTASDLLLPLRRAVLLAEGARLSDAQLLDCFIEHRDPAAFEVLVRRHGPMVLGVCRRLLGCPHAAEDAFQATFLILVRKADTVRPRGQLANWLHGVARNVARKAHALLQRRRAREKQADAWLESVPANEAERDPELLAILDRELARLPEKYRAAVVLCDIEGRSRRDAARELDLPEGTLSSRLAAARSLLARRLARHALPVAALVALLAREASAALPPTLVNQTAAVAAGGATPAGIALLTEGVLTTMLWTKVRMLTAALLLVAGLGLGVTTCLRPVDAATAAEDKAQKEKKEQGPRVRGTVKEVDTGKNTITITVVSVENKEKKSQEKTYPVAADVKVILQDNLTKTQPPPQGKLADLSPGTGVELQLALDGKKVEEITAHGPTLHGHVKSVDGKAGSITFTYKDGELKEKSVVMAKGAKVLLNDGLSKGTKDVEGKLGELAEGTVVLVQLSVDRKTALSVRVEGQTINGELKGIDTGNRTVTVSYKGDGGLVDMTFTLVKGAKVDDGLQPGMNVSVRLSVFDKEKAAAVHGR